MPDHSDYVYIARKEATQSAMGMRILTCIMAIAVYGVLGLLIFFDVGLAWVVSAGFGLTLLCLGVLLSEVIGLMTVRLLYIAQAAEHTLNHAEDISMRSGCKLSSH